MSKVGLIYITRLLFGTFPTLLATGPQIIILLGRTNVWPSQKLVGHLSIFPVQCRTKYNIFHILF